MPADNDLVARNIRRFRLERGLSLGELARRSGISKQTLSKIEQGQGNPTIDTLSALTEGLDVTVRRLLTQWGTPVLVQRADDGSWEGEEGMQQRRLDQIFGSGYVRTSVVRMETAKSPRIFDPHQTGTLHHLYVISGKLRTGPLNEQVELAAGDFVRFPGDVPHAHTCLTDRVVGHMVTTLPQVRQFSPQA